MYLLCSYYFDHHSWLGDHDVTEEDGEGSCPADEGEMHQLCGQLSPHPGLLTAGHLIPAGGHHAGQHEVLPLRPEDGALPQRQEAGLRGHQLSANDKGVIDTSLEDLGKYP